MKQRVHDVRERLTMEHALLVTFIGTSVYMFIASYEFQPAGGMFPRFTSAVVIAFGLLLVFRQYLPTWLQRVVIDDGGMFDVDELAEESVDDGGELETEPEAIDEEAESPPHEAGASDAADEEVATEGTGDDATAEVGERGSLITGGLCVAYLLASYAIGMLWATPVFVVVYTVWTGQRWAAVVGLTILSFALAYVFYDVLNLNIASGWVHEWLIAEVL